MQQTELTTVNKATTRHPFLPRDAAMLARSWES